MKEFDGIFRCGIRHGVINLVCHRNTAHRNGTIGQRLCHGDDVRLDVEFLRGKWCAHAPEPGDHLVKHQQHAVLVTDFADFLEIADRRNQRTGRAGHRFNEHSRQRAAAKIFGNPVQIHRQFCARLGLAFRKALILGPGVANQRDIRQRQAKGLAVADHAGKRHPAHIDAVIGPLAADQPVALCLAARPLIGQDHLDGGFH